MIELCWLFTKVFFLRDLPCSYKWDVTRKFFPATVAKRANLRVKNKGPATEVAGPLA